MFSVMKLITSAIFICFTPIWMLSLPLNFLNLPRQIIHSTPHSHNFICDLSLFGALNLKLGFQKLNVISISVAAPIFVKWLRSRFIESAVASLVSGLVQHIQAWLLNSWMAKWLLCFCPWKLWLWRSVFNGSVRRKQAWLLASKSSGHRGLTSTVLSSIGTNRFHQVRVLHILSIFNIEVVLLLILVGFVFLGDTLLPSHMISITHLLFLFYFI